ncbi:hypothetical protein FRAAL4055 [Frankia alni ACN14a]|uniref:Uncharacterized protein n=1 Tax=Frankia alni (strain DSM 45986 / CECT 9034 / ACN14a) TaxID=326424 RepID=Q0RIH2_FRAAA|nr:hypothetical protein FRAAL4055 [Frankia alni ACN14a]
MTFNHHTPTPAGQPAEETSATLGLAATVAPGAPRLSGGPDFRHLRDMVGQGVDSDGEWTWRDAVDRAGLPEFDPEFEPKYDREYAGSAAARTGEQR